MAQASYQTINLVADTTLSWSFSSVGGMVIADFNNVNASLGPFKIILPNATLAVPTQYFIFNNISLNSFDIMYNDGTTLLLTINPGEVFYLYLTNVVTPNGIWSFIPFGSGTNAINSIVATSSDSSINISNGTLTPPGGTIDFKLPTSISNIISGTNNPGFLVAKTATPSTLTFVTRDLLGGGNIIVNTSDGVSTDPIIELSNNLTGLASAAIGDLQLSGEIITTNVTNGGIQLSSAGTGKVSINGMQIDTSANITGAKNLTLSGSLTVGGTFSSPAMPKAVFTFTDTIVPAGNVINQLTGFNIASITGSNGVYTINFTTPMTSLNYGITFGLGSTGGTSPFVSHVFYTSKTLSNVSIAIVDASGVLVPDVENGVTGVIWLPS